jgi:hypothetical protein
MSSLTRRATLLGCAWFLWVQVVTVSPEGEVPALQYDRFQYMDAYETKSECVQTGVGLHASVFFATPTKRVEWRCLPQGIHPREAR